MNLLLTYIYSYYTSPTSSVGVASGEGIGPKKDWRDLSNANGTSYGAF